MTDVGITKQISLPHVRRMAFDSLFTCSSSSFDAAVDYIVSMIRETREVSKHSENIDIFYDELHSLGAKLRLLGTDSNTFRGIVRIYAEAGEAWVLFISRNPQKYGFLLEQLVCCAKYSQDLEVAKITFNFWNQLAQLVSVDQKTFRNHSFQAIFANLKDIVIEGLDGSEMSPVDRAGREKFLDFLNNISESVSNPQQYREMSGWNRPKSASQSESSPPDRIRFRTQSGEWYWFDRRDLLGK
jgi:hypothetical protein